MDYCCNRYCCCQLTCGRTGRMRNGGSGAENKTPVGPVGTASGGSIEFFFCCACSCFVRFPRVSARRIATYRRVFSFFLIDICSPVEYPFTPASGAVLDERRCLPGFAVHDSSQRAIVQPSCCIKADTRSINRDPVDEAAQLECGSSQEGAR